MSVPIFHFNKVIFRSAEQDINRRLCSVSTHFVCSFVRMHTHIYSIFTHVRQMFAQTRSPGEPCTPILAIFICQGA